MDIVSLVSGAVAGNVGAAITKGTSMGPTLNTILGAVGGNFGFAAIFGLLLPLIMGFIKNRMSGPR